MPPLFTLLHPKMLTNGAKIGLFDKPLMAIGKIGATTYQRHHRTNYIGHMGATKHLHSRRLDISY